MCERSLFRDVKFIHEYGQFNVEAHNLAKAASSLSTGRHVWLLDLLNIIDINSYEPLQLIKGVVSQKKGDGDLESCLERLNSETKYTMAVAV